MLHRVLGEVGRAAVGPPAARAAAGLLAAPQLLRQVHGTAAGLRVSEDSRLSSGHAATHAPPDDPASSPADFDRVADLYLGGLWSKLSERLPGGADAEVEHGRVKLSLPEGGRISITKDPGDKALVVHTNLHDFYGSDGTDSEVPFRLRPGQGTWEAGGEELHTFLEDGLAKHLKIQVDLEPEAQTLYGPDPT